MKCDGVGGVFRRNDITHGAMYQLPIQLITLIFPSAPRLRRVKQCTAGCHLIRVDYK